MPCFYSNNIANTHNKNTLSYLRKKCSLFGNKIGGIVDFCLNICILLIFHFGWIFFSICSSFNFFFFDSITFNLFEDLELAYLMHIQEKKNNKINGLFRLDCMNAFLLHNYSDHSGHSISKTIKSLDGNINDWLGIQ